MRHSDTRTYIHVHTPYLYIYVNQDNLSLGCRVTVAILHFYLLKLLSFAKGQKKNSALMVLWVSSERSVRALGGAPQEEAEAQTWGRVRGG